MSSTPQAGDTRPLMAPDIVPSMNSTSRNFWDQAGIQHMKESTPLCHRDHQAPAQNCCPKHTPVPPDTAPALTNHFQNLLFTPHILDSKMQKMSLGQKARGALQIPPSQHSHFTSAAHISQLLGSHFKTTLPSRGRVWGLLCHLCHFTAQAQNELLLQTQVESLLGGLS